MIIGSRAKKPLLILIISTVIIYTALSLVLIKISSLHASRAIGEIISHELHVVQLLAGYSSCPPKLPEDIRELLVMKDQHIICIKGQTLSPKYLATHQGIKVKADSITISTKVDDKIVVLTFDYSFSKQSKLHKFYISNSQSPIMDILGVAVQLGNNKIYVLSIPYGGLVAIALVGISIVIMAAYVIERTTTEVDKALTEQIIRPIETAINRLCNTACRNTPLNPKIPESIRILITIASSGEARLAKLLKLVTSAKHLKLEDFFKKHLPTIVDILNADGGSVMMKQGNRYEIISHTGIPAENIEYVSNLLRSGSSRLWSIKVLEDSGDIKYLLNTKENPLFIQPESGFKTVTWLGIPITVNNETVAIINIDYASEAQIGNADILSAKLIKALIENNASFHTELNRVLMNLHRDYLTGLPDRKMAETIMKRLQMEGKRFGIIFLDLDNFSTINDTLGHAAGDNILKEIVQAIKMSIRAEDTATRYGGDEFLIIINTSNRETVEKIANRLLEHIRRMHPEISGSIGMVLVSPDMDISEAIEKADKAMYRAKDKGGNTAEWGG